METRLADFGGGDGSGDGGRGIDANTKKYSIVLSPFAPLVSSRLRSWAELGRPHVMSCRVNQRNAARCGVVRGES